MSRYNPRPDRSSRVLSTALSVLEPVIPRPLCPRRPAPNSRADAPQLPQASAPHCPAIVVCVFTVAFQCVGAGPGRKWMRHDAKLGYTRTATEQMLMSSAIDKAINEINFQPLAGKEVFLDSDRLSGFVDQNYVVGTLRQALFSNGVILKPDRARPSTSSRRGPECWAPIAAVY